MTKLLITQKFFSPALDELVLCHVYSAPTAFNQNNQNNNQQKNIFKAGVRTP